MPASLARLVQDGANVPSLIVGSTDRVDWMPPAAVDPGDREAARRLVASYEHRLSPAPRQRSAARVATLLAHYWTPQMPADLQAAVASDWLEDLADFPSWAIDAACREWRRSSPDRKPTPGHIRSICLGEVGDDRKRLGRLRQVANAPIGGITQAARVEPTDDQKAYVSKIVAETVARLRGEA